MQEMICRAEADDGGSANNIDFLFGLTDYAYRAVTDSGQYRGAAAVSVGAGRPVIAKVKEGEARYRVITGYDGGDLLDPDYGNAQNKPEHAPAYAEIEALYVFGVKIKQRYTVLDGLKRIRQVMIQYRRGAMGQLYG